MTRRSESIAALAKALNLLQGELPLVTKQAENSYYKNKYADLASIIDVVRPLLLKHGLAVV